MKLSGAFIFSEYAKKLEDKSGTRSRCRPLIQRSLLVFLAKHMYMVLYCEQVVDRSLPVNWLVNSWSTSQTRLSYILRSLISPHYSWFATTWQGGHVGGQYNRVFSRRIYMEMEFSSQRREILLFLTTNMAVRSRANQQLMKSWFYGFSYTSF